MTLAEPFLGAGLRTPVFVRFSTVAGNTGSSLTRQATVNPHSDGQRAAL